MSLYDYQASKKLGLGDPPFASFIMAAYRKADATNQALLMAGFPEICTELHERYNAPGGLLRGEQAYS